MPGRGSQGCCATAAELIHHGAAARQGNRHAAARQGDSHAAARQGDSHAAARQGDSHAAARQGDSHAAARQGDSHAAASRDDNKGDGDTAGGAASPVFVLLHGFAGSSDAFDELAPRLAAGGCRAIAFDRVGFGRTERPFLPSLSFPEPLQPLAEGIGSWLQSGGQQPASSGGGLSSYLNLRRSFATGLRKPSTLLPPLPWQIAGFSEGSPYSTRFAIRSSLWPLVRQTIGLTTTAASKRRPIYIVGHSAGGPIALRALQECFGSSSRPSDSALPCGTYLAGVALIAPAALDPREDPDLFDASLGDMDGKQGAEQGVQAEGQPPRGEEAASDAGGAGDGGDGGEGGEGGDGGLLDGVPLPDGVKKRVELEARIAAFRALVSLPDAFGLPLARRIADNRDLEAAVRAQMHARMGGADKRERIAEIAEKCKQEGFPRPTQPPPL